MIPKLEMQHSAIRAGKSLVLFEMIKYYMLRPTPILIGCFDQINSKKRIEKYLPHLLIKIIQGTNCLDIKPCHCMQHGRNIKR